MNKDEILIKFIKLLNKRTKLTIKAFNSFLSFLFISLLFVYIQKSDQSINSNYY